MYMKCSQILNLAFIKDLICMYVLTYMSICVLWVFSSPWSPEESARIHGTDGHLGTMNFVKTCSLGIKCPYLLSHLLPCLSYFSTIVSSLQL